VYVVNADGTGETRLTPWRMNACCSVSWSPDGSKILFDAQGTFHTMLPDGTGISEIAVQMGDVTGFAFDPSWSPDGARIVFSMYVEGQDRVDIFTVAADGSDLVRITDSRREDGFPDWGPAPSA
jgi:Tol biopolymer transport system component